MTSRSRSLTPEAPLDTQLSAALSVLGDARQLIRDAARWRALEPHLQVHQTPATGERPAFSGLLVGVTVIVQGTTAPTPGAVIDAHIAARKLGITLRGPDGTY
jgi:hypothetical protein